MIQDEIFNIMNIMDEINYGFKDENGNNIIDINPKKWDESFDQFYYLQTPDELLKSKCGVCWDQVELERKLFQDYNIKFKTYFIYIIDNDMLPSHTFLTYEINNSYYWFEHSWGKYKGIHKYDSAFALFDDVINKFKKEHKEVNDDAPLYLYEYQKPRFHLKCNEFYRYIETQKRVKL